MARALRALVVADSNDIATQCLQVLRNGGFEPAFSTIATAHDLGSALDSGPWDAVFSEYRLDGFDATSALEIVRAADPDLPFILVSGNVGDQEAVAMLRAGANDHVPPRQYARLAPALERELRSAALRREVRDSERSAAFMAALVEASDDAIISKTLDGILTSWNTAAERLYGWTAAEAVGRHVSFLVPRDKADELETIMARLRAGERIDHIETVRLHRDGERIDVCLTISPVRDKAGRLIGVSKTAHDIRERIRGEAAVRESEERFRNAFESTAVGMTLTDLDNRFIRVNAAFARMLGYSPPEMVGMTVREITHPEDWAESSALRERLLSANDAYFQQEKRYFHRDGHAFWVMTNVSLLRDKDGRPLQYVGQTQDVTDRKRAEEAVRESEERFRGAFDFTGVAMVLTDLDNLFIRVNDAFAKLFGYTPSEMLGMTMAGVTHPDDHEKSYAGRRELLAGRQQFFQIEKRYLHRDGHTFWGLTNVSLVRNSAGRPSQYVGQVQDITERKRAERTLRESEERYRLLFDSNPHPMWTYDLSTLRFLAVNDTAIRNYGYSRDEFLGMTIKDIRPSEEVPRLEESIACLTSEPKQGQRWRHRRKDGSLIDVEISSTEFRHGDRPARLLLALDVTDRLRAEAEARRTGDLLHAVADGTSDAVFVKDRTGKYLLFNEAAARFVGKSVAEVLGADDTALFDPASASRVMQRDRRIMEGGQVETEEEVLTAAGVTRTYLAMKAPYRDASGNIAGVIGISHDITRRRQREEELRRSQAMLAVASRVGRMGAWSIELPGKAVTWSEELRAILDFPLDRIPVLDESMALYAPVHRAALQEAFSACIREGVPFDLEVLRDTYEARRIWVRVIGEAVRDAVGNIVRVQGAFQDISERKWNEEALRAGESRLRLFLENVPAQIAMFDREMRYVFASRRWATDYNLGDRDITGLSHYELFPDVPYRWREIHRRCLAGAIERCDEDRYERADGSVHWIRWEVRPWMEANGEIGGIIIFSEEITARKRAEESLRYQHALLQCQSEASPDGILVVGPDNRVLSFNRKFIDVWGIPEALVAAGDDVPILALARRLTADPEGFSTRVAAIYADPDTHSQDEVAMADGRTLDRYSGPIRSADGENLGRIWYFRDITERKRAEAKHQMLARIIEHSRDFIALADMEGKITFMNAGARRMIGLADGADETRLHFTDYVHPDSQAFFLDTVIPTVRGKGIWEGDMQLRHMRTGATIDIFRTAFLLDDPVSGTTSFATVTRDITARKRIERELKERERLLGIVTGSARVGLVVVNSRYEYLFANEAYAEIFGFDPAGVVGRHVHELLAEGWSQIQPRLDRALAGERVVYELKLPPARASTDPRWYRVMYEPRMESGVPSVVVVVMDISENKRAEEAIRASEERYRRLVDVLPAAVFIHDGGRLKFCNPAFVGLVGGKDGAELIGIRALDFAHPECHAIIGQRMETMRRTGSASAGMEMRIVRLDGCPVPVYSVSTPIGNASDILVVLTDLSEREQSMELLRSVMSSVNDAILTIDERGVVRSINPATQRMFGYAGEELVGGNVAKLMPQPDRKEHDDYIANYLRTGDAKVIGIGREVDGLRKDGTTFPLDVTVTEFLLDGKRHFTGVLRDISERKKAEAALRLRDRAIQEVTQGILITDPNQADNPIVYVNSGSESLTGYASEEMLGRNCRFLQGEGTDQAVVSRLRDAIRAGEACTVELLNYRKEGTPFWNELSISPVRDEAGRLTHFVGVQADVTARRNAEQAVRHAQKRLQHVLTSSPSVLFTLEVAPDQVLGINWMSDNIRELLGYAPEEAFGAEWWIANIHPEDRNSALSRTNQALFSEDHAAHEYRFRHRDGKYRWTQSEIRLIRDAAGKPVEAVGSWSDITQRKALEDQFHQAQKMEAVGQLAGGIAHDFNNLLTIINGYSELLLQGVSPDDPAAEMLTEIHKAGERSSGLTRQLLAFSRQQVLAPQVLSLNAVVAGTEKMLGRLIGEDIELVAALEPDLWSVRADPGQIDQVLLNLAVNARDAMPRGGRLTIETRNVQWDGSYTDTRPDARAGAYVLLAVSDTGTGMPPEVKAKIFEPFFTTKGPGKGTGLGLATVYGIVKQSGGHLDVYSEVGIGTSFKIYLPRAEKAEPAKARPGRQASPRGTETVLLAEDEKGVRAMARVILAGCGYRVLEAADGDEAIRIAVECKEPIDLLITDVVMPGTGGRSLAERMSELFPGIRVLFVSGYTDDAVIRHGVLREGVNFLQKPFSPSALALKVREILDNP